MADLTLDELTHEYRLGDRPVLGVSHILEAAGLIDKRFLTEEGKQRGTFIHQAIEYYVQGVLDEARTDLRLIPYVAAYKEFERVSGFKVDQVDGVWQCEVKKSHPVYKFAGKLDLIGRIGSRRFVIDLKSGAPDSWHGWQLAGYAMLDEASPGNTRPERANLYVRPDGTYRFDERRDRSDYEIFKAAITIAQARIANGLAA